MCGIAGFVDFSGHERADAQARIERMTDGIAHRGPDGAGASWTATRRWAIAARHHRPGRGTSRSACADGQRADRLQRRDLQLSRVARGARGARATSFRTHSDTEVILLGYLEWGERCVERLNGMFAFAIWDARDQTLLLARDRVGKKPLYFYRHGSIDRVRLGVQGAARRRVLPGRDRSRGARLLFLLRLHPGAETIYQGVRQAAGGAHAAL